MEEPEELKQIRLMGHELIRRLYATKSRFVLEALKQHCERALEELSKDDSLRSLDKEKEKEES